MHNNTKILQSSLQNSLKKSINLNTYTYKGKDAKGQYVAGECRAKTKKAAKYQLTSSGITVTKIQKKQTSLFESNKIKDKDIINFTRQLSTMIKSGLPIIESLNICAAVSNNSKVESMINNIRTSVESGHSFSESLALYPKQFHQFYRNLLYIGENTGKLDLMLTNIADYEEKMQRLKSKLKKAMLYPAMIVLVSIVVTSILLIYVVPQFESMFQNLNTELPWFTQFILNISRWLQSNWFIVLTVTSAVSSITVKYIKQSITAQMALDKFVLKIPLFGGILEKICIARFARTLTTMLSAGVPLLACLPPAAKLVGNSLYSKAIGNIQTYVENGQLLNQAMQNTGLFNAMTIQMTAVGENSGALDDMLLRIAELYEEEVDSTISNLTNILEPVIILIISILVGGLIVAMYLPIFSLGSAL